MKEKMKLRNNILKLMEGEENKYERRKEKIGIKEINDEKEMKK